MCGVFGYVGPKDPLKVCITGLEKLEYRGYDSTGIAGVRNGAIVSCKKAGKLSNLKSEINLQELQLAIGHTRWATHGSVTDLNAHPHFDAAKSIAIVHNGGIENYTSLRDLLIGEGHRFFTETDTEVIAQLIAKNYAGDLLAAVQKTIPLLRGIFAFAAIHKNHPDTIIASARECPLAVACDEMATEAIISSDPNAFFGASLDVVFLRGAEIAKVQKGRVEVYDPMQNRIAKKAERITVETQVSSKEGFEHYLLKEIYEQPITVQNAMLGRFDEPSQSVAFESNPIDAKTLQSFQRIWLLGCGTSSHAGMIGAHYLEEIAKVPASYEIGSEARYRTDLLSPEILTIAISQSGETADTLGAIAEVKSKMGKVLGLCNVKNSTLTREADGCIFLKAGPEISVCSTKAFTSQIAVLYLFALQMAQLRGKTGAEIARLHAELKKIPGQIQQVIDQSPAIQKLAQKYARYDDFFFMGRSYMYPTCLEAALKLKEISYVNANGSPAGELKHGPIALLSPDFPVVAFCANQKTIDKTASSMLEAKARGAPVIAFAPEGASAIGAITSDIIWLPPAIDPLSPFASTVAGQLFAYHFAKERGCDIDQPRNLAKSVTVE